MSIQKGTLTKQSVRWNPILDVRLSASGRGGGSNIDTAEIDATEGLTFRFRLLAESGKADQLICVAYPGNYRAEYPLHRRIYQRAMAVAGSRLRAEKKRMKNA